MAANGQPLPENGEGSHELRAFASRASPAAAFHFAQRFMHHLKEALQDGSEPSAAECSAFEFVVRGAGGPEPHAGWLIKYWTSSAGTIAGVVVDNRGGGNEAAACSSRARVEFSSFKDILDLVANRRAVTSALMTRRIKMSGDVMSTMKTLAPTFKRAGEHVAKEIPDILEMVENGRDESVSSERSYPSNSTGTWMHDSASPSCLICGLPWRPIIRQRHHCRLCGKLVCGKCSTLQLTGMRQCSSCVRHGGATSFSAGFGNTSFGMGDNNFSRRATSMISPDSTSFQVNSLGNDNNFSRRATSMINSNFPANATHSSLPEVPDAVSIPGLETHGLLYAQVNAALSEQLRATINASPPRELEQQLWDRVQSLQKAMANLQTPAIWVQVVNSLVRSLFPLILCLLVFMSFTVTGDDVPVQVERVWSYLIAWVPTLAPRLAIFVGWFAIVVMFLSMRLSLIVIIANFSIHRWFGARQFLENVVRLEFSLPENLLITNLLFAYPLWACLCGAFSCFILCTNRTLGRLASIYLCASVPIAVYFSCKTVSRLFRLSNGSRDWLYGRADLAMAPFLTNRFLALGGLFVKMGQWVSNASSFAPVAFIEHLQKLVDDAPIDSERYVKANISAEFGKPPEELFDEFEMTPLASASIAQVHRARLRTGKMETVAIKLQHEGVVPLMLSDLRALTHIVKFSCWLGGEEWADTQNLFESWSKEMVKELDFSNEVKNLQEMHAGIGDAGIDVVVPKLIDSLTSKSVFAMEFCEGFRFTDRERLALHGVDRKTLGARVLHTAACQLLELGLFNSDPHAGNILCQVRGSSAIPVLLDFGNCIRLPPDRRIAYCNLIVALCETSVTKVREALDKLGLVTTQSTDHPERDLEYMLLMFRDTGSRSKRQKESKEFFAMRKEQKQMDFRALGANTKAEQKKVKKQVQRYPKKLPDEFILFTRMLLLVQGLCMQLDVELPLLRIFESHARRALISFYPLPQRALSVLPTAARSVSLQPSAAYENLRKRLLSVIRSVCSDRPGLGIQVCVCIGDACVVDECGGVLGSADPRPMERDTPIPLADLSRLPLLLAILKASRAKQLSYSKPVQTASTTKAAHTLRDVLTHRAFAARGAARSALASTSANSLRSDSCMRALATDASAAEPLAHDQARYLPVGAGYIAAESLHATQDGFVGALRRLPGADVFGSREIGYGLHPESSPRSSLSSTLFADFRAMMASSGINIGFLGAFKPPAADESNGQAPIAKPPNGDHANGAASSSPSDEEMPKSMAFGILDAAGGLLVDPALAVVAVDAATPSLENSQSNQNGHSSVCPDLAVASSARALAAVIAASRPATNMSDIYAREPTSRGMFDALGFVPRNWDERGLEVFLSEDGGSPAAVGTLAAHGLLGAAVQWPSSAREKATTTVVVLGNEMSLSMLPAKIVRETCACLSLPQLINFPP